MDGGQRPTRLDLTRENPLVEAWAAYLTFTPGFRTYLGWNLYLFGGVEMPATEPKPFDYQVLAELLMEY